MLLCSRYSLKNTSPLKWKNMKIKMLCKRVLFDIWKFELFSRIFKFWNCCRSSQKKSSRHPRVYWPLTKSFQIRLKSLNLLLFLIQITSNTKPLWYKWFLTESIIPTQFEYIFIRTHNGKTMVRKTVCDFLLFSFLFKIKFNCHSTRGWWGDLNDRFFLC